jgi:N-acetyl-alpha-D-glucosaminyl L-malate synthase BshA
LQIFDTIKKEVPAILILVGDGPEKALIDKLCNEKYQCDSITMLGNIVDPESILAIADLFVLPSETESFGLSALEAMASKVPVISTNTGGLPEVNVDGVTGYTCTVGDVNDMASKAIALLKNEKELAKFKNSAFKHAQNFDMLKIIPLYENLYKKVLLK